MDKKLVASLLLAASIFAFPLSVGAQEVMPGADSPPAVNNPGTQNDGGVINNNGGAGTNTSPGTGVSGVSFDWRWLLPLLAIPVIYLALRGGERDEYSTRTHYAGVKGGRTRPVADEEVEEIEEERRTV